MIEGARIGTAGAIGRQIPASPLPERRPRTCPRAVKRAISKYQATGPDLDRTCHKAHIDTAILTGDPPRQPHHRA